ncbi:hypothetical protein N9767_01275 [Planktomarina temperata]|nr:hypothetical protein [Planktomarina temperata]
MIRHLHIGKNNVIGRAFTRSGNVNVIASNEINKVDLNSYDKISISAFDPLLKEKLGNDKLVSNILERINSDIEILYFSTVRAFEYKIPSRHISYAANKKASAQRLLSHAPHAKIVYLPNILPKTNKDQSNFIKMFHNNLINGFIRFDVSKDSSWNFICPDSLVTALNIDDFKDKHNVFINKTWITALQLVEAARLHYARDFEINYGDKKVVYPAAASLTHTVVTSRNILTANDIIRVLGNE